MSEARVTILNTPLDNINNSISNISNGSENKNIIEFIHNNDYENALNLTLFLKSIPLDIPKKDSKTNELIDLAKMQNYNKLSLLLAEKLNS